MPFVRVHPNDLIAFRQSRGVKAKSRPDRCSADPGFCVGRAEPALRAPQRDRRRREYRAGPHRVNSPLLCTILSSSGGEERGMTDTTTTVALGEDYPELRESVRKICERYPGPYWRNLETEQAYPTEFITELTQGGFLASLIPEEYGGSGLPLRAAAVILEEINASGCTASQGHAQMYIMGTVLRHGSEEQKQRYLPKIASGELRLQAFGVTEPTTGSDTTKLKTRAVRQGNHYLINGHN